MSRRRTRVVSPPVAGEAPEPNPAIERMERDERSGAAATFGQWLRSQREHRDVPLRSIADATKISIRYLQALEDDRYDVLPAPVFARGFLREYAKYVGLDADEVVTYYMSALGDSGSTHPDAEAAVERVVRSPWASVVLLLVGLAALLGVVAAISYWASHRSVTPAPPPAIVAPAVAPPAVAPPIVVPPVAEVAAVEPEPAEPLAALRVTVEFVERCWVEARVDRVQRISENYTAGESLRLEGEQAIFLTLGNPGGARIEVNGMALPVDAPAGRVLRDLEINLETAAALAASRGSAATAP